MKYLWGGMILLGVIFGTLTGNLREVTEAIVNSAKEAVTLCISMAGITALWSGIMTIAERSGLVETLSHALKPLLRFLFPELEGEEKAKHYISLNFLSNLLGLNWASTASGLKAFQELDRINSRQVSAGAQSRAGQKSGGSKTASTAMCTFLIINVSSLQLIPVNMIAFRAQYGSANPTAIVGPAIVATGLSTLMAVVFCRIMDRR